MLPRSRHSYLFLARQKKTYVEPPYVAIDCGIIFVLSGICFTNYDNFFNMSCWVALLHFLYAVSTSSSSDLYAHWTG